MKTKIDFWSQLASDIPKYTKFLVEKGINSITFNLEAEVWDITNKKPKGD